MFTCTKKIVQGIFFCMLCVSVLRAQQSAPPDSAANVTFQKNGQLIINYDHSNILTAALNNTDVHFLHIENKDGNKVEQVIVLESKSGNDFTLTGTITGSNESFSCEADYPRKGTPVVRHSSGSSASLLNRAVYDRQKDWVLSFDMPYSVTIKPAKEGENENVFQFTIKSSKLSIRFRPRFYQCHKGLKYFEPWTYKVWDKPVVGWCSWFAYLNTVREQNIYTVADTLSATLLPYGYQYLQIDDGYQQEPIGKPENWLQPNNKFPSGMAALSKYISSKGLKPGIWTNVACADSVFANNNSLLYVKNEFNKPAFGEWIGYIMDGSNPQTINKLIQPVYTSLHNNGWDYFKVDALRHLKYEGYNSYEKYFNDKKINRDEAFRNVIKSVRQSIGTDTYLLACWGIRPELIGLIDGCRIGNDGFSYAGLAQFNSFNNVVWRNDPDHVELTDVEAFRSCSVTSLTGSVLLLTDKPERYKGRILEAARRTSPVLFTKPVQVYEVDPSRLQSLQRYTTEVSGDGPRVFDAGYTALTELYSLEINRPFEDWLLLGRMNDKNKEISLSELGLYSDREYEVFEFWTKKYLGTAKKDFVFPMIDTNYNCQVFCFRQKMDHPQLLATSRHISCGGLELKNCVWNNNKLYGKSELVAKDEYKLYIHIPDGYKVAKVTTGTTLISNQQEQNVLVICMKSDIATTTNWEITFTK